MSLSLISTHIVSIFGDSRLLYFRKLDKYTKIPATLFETTCHGSIMILFMSFSNCFPILLIQSFCVTFVMDENYEVF